MSVGPDHLRIIRRECTMRMYIYGPDKQVDRYTDPVTNLNVNDDTMRNKSHSFFIQIQNLFNIVYGVDLKNCNDLITLKCRH